MNARTALLTMALLCAPAVAAAELVFPPGFTVKLYVTGEGYEGGGSEANRGIPASSTLAVDGSGVLYAARTGRRYYGGEVEDVFPVYRIPPGGARLSPATERPYLYGPPLPNPQIAAIRGGTELYVTTFDRERQVGVLYRIVDGHAELVAGGTPPKGTPAFLKQPEGGAVDRAGNLYVADRAKDAIAKLDPRGRVVDPKWLSFTRPRILTMDAEDTLWVGGDGPAEQPWQRGPGEIWRVVPGAAPNLLLRGPVPAGFALSPGGHLFIADRQNAKILFVTADGRSGELASFTAGDAPRTLGFAPVTRETQRAGIAGDLFIVTIPRGAWRLNEVLRVSGPFDDLVRQRLTAPR